MSSFTRPEAARDRLCGDPHEAAEAIPGTFVNVGQPIGHRLSHMLSGVSAKIAVKIFGPDLEVLREKGAQVRDLAKTIPGLTDVNLEAQVPIPQIKIEVNRERAVAYGVQPGMRSMNKSRRCSAAKRSLSCARVSAPSICVMRLPESWRDSPDKLGDLLIETERASAFPCGSSLTSARAKAPT
jgi:Cu/Ag efflux pump CusA